MEVWTVVRAAGELQSWWGGERLMVRVRQLQNSKHPGKWRHVLLQGRTNRKELLCWAGTLAGRVRVPTTWSFHFQLKVQVASTSCWSSKKRVQTYLSSATSENVPQANTEALGYFVFQVSTESTLSFQKTIKKNYSVQIVDNICWGLPRIRPTAVSKSSGTLVTTHHITALPLESPGFSPRV